MMDKLESFVQIEAVAEHFAVSVSTIRSWIRSRAISHDAFIKVGPTYRFRITDVEMSLLSNGAEWNENDDMVAPSAQKIAEHKVARHMAKKEAEVEVVDFFDEDI
jgi:uncharacterized protein YjcR|tara:strand:- start:115 stop:429 length:315 start_codon:yes stop_codon:yes gene_type:complete